MADCAIAARKGSAAMALEPVKGYGLHSGLQEVHAQKPFTSVRDANQDLRFSA